MGYTWFIHVSIYGRFCLFLFDFARKQDKGKKDDDSFFHIY